MRTAKEKAALLQPEQAAHIKTPEQDHSTVAREIVAVIEKSGAEEVHIRLNEYARGTYVDIRLFVNYAGKRVPTRKGITIPLDMLQPLRDALLKAQVQAATAADPTAQA
jgi:hypothetical protein